MKNKFTVILLIAITVIYSAKRDYLIITPEKYVDNLSEFIKFREMSYNVELVTTKRCGKTMESIKTWVQDSLPVLPRYMLLVGHVDDIEADTTQEFSDGNYGQYGDPDYPEVFVGRFPVHNKEQLQNIIDKTIYMESNRKSLKKHYEMAGDAGSTYTDYFYMQTNAALNKLPGSWTYNYTIYRKENTITLESFIDSIFYQKKPYVYVYKGHGSNEYQMYTSLKWKLSHSDVDTMTNKITPISIGLCCLSNDIKNPNSFGEYFVNSKGGAVTYFASSRRIISQLSGELGEIIPKTLFAKDNVDKTIGEGVANILQRKKMYSKNNTIYWNLLGDPGLRLFNSDDPTPVSYSKNGAVNQSIISFSKTGQGLQFNLSVSKELEIEIYNLKGDQMMIISSKKYSVGEHIVALEKLMPNLSSGLYVCLVSGSDISKSSTFYFYR